MRKTGEDKLCESCGTSFYVPAWRVKAKFCSPECMYLGRKPRGRTLYTKICKWCTKEFQVPPHRLDTARFCSHECTGHFNASSLDISEGSKWLVGVRAANEKRKIEPWRKKAMREYHNQRAQAIIRRIDWNFTFDEWLKFWLDSGHYEERGLGKLQYCMARFGDIGPYALDNVRIVTTQQNRDECENYRAPNRRLTDENIREIRQLEGQIPRKEIAERFGINYWHIRDIQKRKVYADLV